MLKILVKWRLDEKNADVKISALDSSSMYLFAKRILGGALYTA